MGVRTAGMTAMDGRDARDTLDREMGEDARHWAMVYGLLVQAGQVIVASRRRPTHPPRNTLLSQ